MSNLTAQYAKWYKLDEQGADESDYAFRHRISGALREQGKLIEAHEAFQNARHDDPDGGERVTTGIMGALAFALEGRGFQGDPVHPDNGVNQVGDDIALGTINKNPEPDMSPEAALLMLKLFG